MIALTLVSKSDRPLRPLVEAAIHNELRLLEAGLRRTQLNIQGFEKQHGWSTEEFLSRYENDELPESLAMTDWIGEARLLERIREKIQTLRDIQFEN